MATYAHKPVTRETAAFMRHTGKVRALIVTLDARTISLRFKGTKTTQSVDIDAVYWLALRRRVAKIAAEKAAKKKARKS